MRRLAMLLFASGTTFAACDGTDADEGRDAAMQVARAQFFHGDMPAETNGPEVRSVTVGSTFEVSATERTCIGEMAREATAVALGLAGDRGYWIVRADIPSAAAIDSPTFEAFLSFSPKMTPGPRELIVRAVDGERRFGPPLAKSITMTERALPEGELVVSLSWDNHANLDLHVVDPNGAEIFKRDVNSHPSPGSGAPREAPNAPRDGGVLDFDSHADCVRDGRRAENVVWSDPPPRGHYLVRVDTFSLCGEPGARWRAQAFLRGVRIAASEGVSTEVDTTFSHDRGAGLLALEFDVP